jgi:hypothetical protein
VLRGVIVGADVGHGEDADRERRSETVAAAAVALNAFAGSCRTRCET